MRTLTIAICFLAATGVTAAQTVEVGARVASACLGSDGSLCGNETSPLTGGHISLWFADRIELNGSIARVALPAYEFPDVDQFDQPIEIAVTDRSRDFISLVFAHHFRRAKSVRPMLGIGSGWYADARKVTCEPRGCESRGRLGQIQGLRPNWDVDVVFLAGLSGVIRNHWVVRGGWQSHRFANEENSTQELFLALGYRFGGS